jgi:hypothetical protein
MIKAGQKPRFFVIYGVRLKKLISKINFATGERTTKRGHKFKPRGEKNASETVNIK